MQASASIPASATPVPIAPGALPLVGHAPQFLLRPLSFVQRLRAHGDLVCIRIGSHPLYVVNSPTLIHRMLGAESAQFGKGGRVYDKVRQVLGNGIGTSDGTFHQRQRRLVQPSLHRERLARYAQHMHTLATAKVGSWQPGQVLDLGAEMLDLTLDIAANCLVFAGVGQDAVAELRGSLPIVLREMGRRAVSLEVFEKLPTRANRRFDEANARLRATIHRVIETYRADPRDRGDLLSMLLAVQDPDTGEGMSDQQVYDEIITLAAAAAETPAVTLTWLLHELGRHPAIEHRVRSEIDEALTRSSDDPSALMALDYTRRVISETLRMHSSVWVFTRRTTAAVDIDGWHLPSGTDLLFSPYALHRDPMLWADPMHFDPDRWLPERSAALPPNAFIPFGLGRHRCIGERFAWIEMPIILAAISRRWQLHPVPGHTVREVAWITVHPNAVRMTAAAR